MDDSVKVALRSIPSIHDLLADPAVEQWTSLLRPDVVTTVARRHQERVRDRVLNGDTESLDVLLSEISDELRYLAGGREVVGVNGTGVIIHTNLGRAPVSRATAEAMATHSARYQALEIDPISGQRGGRGQEVADLMRALTGAEATLVVNNNAAAVMLTLSALCLGREVVVSRGEAVEIGGGFRIPDVLQQSGATLVEVGTTNRTYVRDYEAATGDATAAYLKVHASNFAILGFTAAPGVADLAPVAHNHGVRLIEDVGSGCLLDTSKYGLSEEPTLGDSIAAGADVVCASGDKLLGGPQAGLILGRQEVVQEIARHPMARALRADKATLAGLAATLRHYLRGTAEEEIPVWWSMSRSTEWLRNRVLSWKSQLGVDGLEVIETESVVGGGSLPGRTLPSYALAFRPSGGSMDGIARRLRTGSPAVFPRIVDDRVAIDARTVLEDEDKLVVSAVRNLFEARP